MKKLVIFSLLLLSQVATAKPVVVAVIDSGITDNVLAGGRKNGICKMGHKDFTGEGLTDYHGHGTNIAGLIAKNAGDKDFCIVVLKIYQFNREKCMQNRIEEYKQNMSKFAQQISTKVKPEYLDAFVRTQVHNKCNADHLKWMQDAIRYAINIKVNVINISGGGIEASDVEKSLITKALKRGIKVVAAAGNERSDLAKTPYYPAMYDKRIVVVGNGKSMDKRDPTSNYGSAVTVWEDGDNQEAHGITLSGTSQATAIYTGKLVRTIDVQSRRQVKGKPSSSRPAIR